MLRRLRRLFGPRPAAAGVPGEAEGAGVPLDRLARTARALELPLAGADWASTDALVADVAAALDGAPEVDPERLSDLGDLRNQRRSPLTTRQDVETDLRAEVDDEHGSFHKRHADVVRRAIPYREIRSAVYGQPATSPYR